MAILMLLTSNRVVFSFAFSVLSWTPNGINLLSGKELTFILKHGEAHVNLLFTLSTMDYFWKLLFNHISHNLQ